MRGRLEYKNVLMEIPDRDTVVEGYPFMYGIMEDIINGCTDDFDSVFESRALERVKHSSAWQEMCIAMVEVFEEVV